MLHSCKVTVHICRTNGKVDPLLVAWANESNSLPFLPGGDKSNTTAKKSTLKLFSNYRDARIISN